MAVNINLAEKNNNAEMTCFREQTQKNNKKNILYV